MSGKSQTKSISRVLVNKDWALKVAGVILAFGFGMLAITLHARLRLPLKMPGHHGIEFMALLFISSSVSKIKFTGTIFSLGVGTMLFIPFLGFTDPYAPLLFMLPGIFIDIIQMIRPVLFINIYVAGIIGGLAYGMIPFLRILITLLTGFVYKSMLAGPIFPLLSYFAFGFAGTIITVGIIKSLKK